MQSVHLSGIHSFTRDHSWRSLALNPSPTPRPLPCSGSALTARSPLGCTSLT